MFAIYSFAFAQLVLQKQENMNGMDMNKKDTMHNNAGMSNQMMGTASLVPLRIMVGEKGKWMVGYQVMFDKMRDNFDGSKSISNEKILQNYKATPTDMWMQIHMAMVMYAHFIYFNSTSFLN